MSCVIAVYSSDGSSCYLPLGLLVWPHPAWAIWTCEVWYQCLEGNARDTMDENILNSSVNTGLSALEICLLRIYSPMTIKECRGNAIAFQHGRILQLQDHRTKTHFLRVQASVSKSSCAPSPCSFSSPASQCASPSPPPSSSGSFRRSLPQSTWTAPSPTSSPPLPSLPPRCRSSADTHGSAES